MWGPLPFPHKTLRARRFWFLSLSSLATVRYRALALAPCSAPRRPRTCAVPLCHRVLSSSCSRNYLAASSPPHQVALAPPSPFAIVDYHRSASLLVGDRLYSPISASILLLGRLPSSLVVRTTPTSRCSMICRNHFLTHYFDIFASKFLFTVIRLVSEGALRHQTHLFIGTLDEFGITLITFPFLPKNCYASLGFLASLDMMLIVMYSIHYVLCSEPCR